MTALFEQLKDIKDKSEKKETGRQINELKISVEAAYAEIEKQLSCWKKRRRS